MPDVHVPKLGEHTTGKSIVHIALEVILISTGVFLGLMGEQWRERSHQRELAEQALRRFRTEITENRKAVEGVRDYHVTLQKQLQTEYDKPPAKRNPGNIEIHGIRPANFDQAAWDLALGTQSLAYIDSDLGLSLSNIYNVQGRISEMTRGIIGSMYLAPPIDDRNTSTFMGALLIYYGDMVILEPRLLTMYGDALQKIDKALGDH
jgi:hypothetical protein